ncbi:response regulator transcription factor [Poseidonocella sp. HB161398]|uniref:response regulator transcription factor n=1 Tax=Poseidonocella sp. HB161398 TaxID=2320855 RepID=UPI001108148D|nr:helix-turn-helix transcriptional regulator [Poseidonocella sp. HB161398]
MADHQELLPEEATPILAWAHPDVDLGSIVIQILPGDPGTAEEDAQLIGRISIDGRCYTLLGLERRDLRDGSGFCRLSPRELQIAALLREGVCSNKEIARRLRLSPYTVATYLKRISDKLDCRSRTQIALRFSEVAEGGPASAG